MLSARKPSSRSAFTLVELLIVIVILAVLASIAIPRFINSGSRSKDASLKANLKVVRNAVQVFNSDCGSYPESLADLEATTAPASGLDPAASSKVITPSDWHGPYLASVPTDPVSSAALTYSKVAGTVGTVTSSASGSDDDGNTYSGY